MSTRDIAFRSVAEQDATRTLFAQTMGLVAVTAAFFAGGAYLGRHMSSHAGRHRRVLRRALRGVQPDLSGQR